MEKIKLILCDVDGTLVNKDRQLTDRTKQTIINLKKTGIYFGIASGRPCKGLLNKLKSWGIEDYVDVLIGMNGAQVYDCTEHKLHTFYMLKKEWVKEIIETYQELDFNACVYEDNSILCERIEYQIIRSSKNNEFDIIEVDKERLYSKEREKLLYTLPAEKMEFIEEFCKKHPSPYYHGFKTASDLFEFTDIRVSKIYGIEQFCKIHHFSLKETVAFGDTTNDVDMIQGCGYGICMANGTDDAKSVADYIAPSNDEDGVAVTIEEMFLKDYE